MICSICLSEMNKNKMISLETCKHNFCKNCIKEWNKCSNTCPMCRQNITYNFKIKLKKKKKDF